MMTIKTLADVQFLERAPHEGLGLPGSVYDALRQRAEEHPDRVATLTLDTGTAEEAPRQATYAETFSQVTQAANLLRAWGVGSTDAVTLLMPIIPETSILLWAAGTAGIANPVNTFLELDYLEAIVRAAGTKVLVGCDPSVDPVAWPKVEALKKRIPDIKVLQVRSRAGAGSAMSYETALSSQPGDRLRFEHDLAPDSVTAYFHTGGTTGLPKLAKHTRLGHLLQSWCLRQFEPSREPRVGMVGVPLFHVGGALAICLHHLLCGHTLVYLHPNGFREPVVVQEFLRNAERFGVSTLGAVPAIWSALLNLPTDGIDLSCVDHGRVGGSTLSVEVARAVEDKFGFPLIEAWGMTELHGFGTMTPVTGEHRTGSIGIRNPHMELQVVQLGENGLIERECEPDEAGLLVARGPQVTAGYVDPEHNRGAWIGEGWFNTGDLARIDSDGYVWLTGRAKDLIIRGGHNIDPALIEDVLYAHPGVELAAAVAQPDRRVGEMPTAFVQMKSGAPFEESALKDHLSERIAERAALPVAITALEAMPLTRVGKIFKPYLRDRAAERVLQAELDAITEPGEGIEVVVAQHPKFGTLVTASVRAKPGPRRDALCEACTATLGAYPLRFEVVVVS